MRKLLAALTVSLALAHGAFAAGDSILRPGHPERYVRRNWWDLLRRALALPNYVYDANLDTTDPRWRPVDEAPILEALRARRAP